MERQATTIEEELKRLKKHAPRPDYLARKRELYSAQVTEFASMLKSAVKKALEQEASSDIANTWLDEATQALKAILPELPEGLELSQEFKDAAARVQQGLNKQFLKDALKPSEEEINDHTRELAQCVLANWFSILEQAKHDNGTETQALSGNAMPIGVDDKALYEGVEAFVLPVNIVASEFTNYLDSLKQKGPVVELAPALYLVHKGKQNYLASSEKVSQNLITVQSQPVDKQVPIKVPTKVDLYTPKPEIAKLVDKQMERQVAIAVAQKAMQELNPYRIDRCKYHNLKVEKRKVQSLISKDTSLSRRISAAAVTYAISSATSKNTVGIDPKVEKLICQNQKVRRIFNISVQLAKQALAMRKARKLKGQMKIETDEDARAGPLSNSRSRPYVS